MQTGKIDLYSMPSVNNDPITKLLSYLLPPATIEPPSRSRILSEYPPDSLLAQIDILFFIILRLISSQININMRLGC